MSLSLYITFEINSEKSWIYIEERDNFEIKAHNLEETKKMALDEIVQNQKRNCKQHGYDTLKLWFLLPFHPLRGLA